MKEITRIHLAKTPFSVEVDAKKSLEQYLDSIQKNIPQKYLYFLPNLLPLPKPSAIH